MTTTLDYYNQNAERYAQVNHGAPTSPDLTAFLERVRAAASSNTPIRVLDAGCGTGRDTLAMMAQGIEVDAFDGSEAMVELATRLTGHPTQHMQFEDLKLPADTYDGVWAMASLLHVPRANLPQVLVDLGAALKPGGVLFASFKYGTQDRLDEKGERAFTDLDEKGVEEMLSGMEGWELIGTTCRQPPESQSNREPWFSMTLQRVGPAPALKADTTPRSRPRSR